MYTEFRKAEVFLFAVVDRLNAQMPALRSPSIRPSMA
jgi:hypothetical protein